MELPGGVRRALQDLLIHGEVFPSCARLQAGALCCAQLEGTTRERGKNLFPQLFPLETSLHTWPGAPGSRIRDF